MSTSSLLYKQTQRDATTMLVTAMTGERCRVVCTGNADHLRASLWQVLGKEEPCPRSAALVDMANHLVLHGLEIEHAAADKGAARVLGAALSWLAGRIQQRGGAITHCLTLAQPWAWALVNLRDGMKLINRFEGLGQDDIGRSVAVVTSGRWDARAARNLRGMGYEFPTVYAMVRRAVIGQVRLVGEWRNEKDPWYLGPFAWGVDELRLIEPVSLEIVPERSGLWMATPRIRAAFVQSATTVLERPIPDQLPRLPSPTPDKAAMTLIA